MNTLISGLRGFIFNGKHNNGMEVVMHSKSIQSPSKKKIKQTVPFMNGSYDFSSVGNNGEVTYEEREITIILGLPTQSKEELQILYTKVLSWIVDVSGKQKLIFDVTKDYYFKAEVEKVTSFEELMEFGKLTLTFTAEPFKYSIDYVGADIWDTFNFYEDYMQDVEYDIVTSKTITIYNPGRRLIPIINCSTPMNIIQNGKSYSLASGDNKVYGFYLNSSSNSLVINGTGHIRFIFRKENL